MQTIQALLNRIRWDPGLSQADFEVGFVDKIAHRQIRIPFKSMQFFADEHFFFHYLDEEGMEHQVPFHRIKSVYQDGELIWHREH